MIIQISVDMSIHAMKNPEDVKNPTFYSVEYCICTNLGKQTCKGPC